MALSVERRTYDIEVVGLSLSRAHCVKTLGNGGESLTGDAVNVIVGTVESNSLPMW